MHNFSSNAQRVNLGSIVLTPTGSSGALTFKWSDGYVGNIRDNLEVGEYSIIVADGIGNRKLIKETVSYEKVYSSVSVDITLGNGIFTKSGVESWENGELVSNNIIYNGSTDFVSRKIDLNDQERIFGFQDADIANVAGYSDMLYGFYQNGSSLQIIRDGVIEPTVYTVTSGDDIKIRSFGSRIDFLLNETPLVLSSTYNVNLNYTELVKLNGVYGDDNNVNTSGFASFISTIKQIKCGISSIGSIELTPSQRGMTINSVSWSNGATTLLNDNLSAGDYTVNISTDYQSLVETFTIVNQPLWEKKIGVSDDVKNNSINKNSGSGWNAGFVSNNILTDGNDGWFEFTINDIPNRNSGEILAIGFTSASEANSIDPNTIDFGIKCHQSYLPIMGGTLLNWSTIIENGVAGNINEIPINEGSKIKIHKIGSTLYYYVNGRLLSTTSTVPAGTDLIIDASINMELVSIENASVSFNCDPSTIPASNGDTYARLRDGMDATYHMSEGNVVRFIYEEKYKAGDLNYNIRKDDGTKYVTVPIQSKNYGTNLIALDITTLALTPGNYILTVVDEKGKDSYLRFKKQ